MARDRLIGNFRTEALQAHWYADRAAAHGIGFAEHAGYDDDANPREAVASIKLTVRDEREQGSIESATRRSLELFRHALDAGFRG